MFVISLDFELFWGVRDHRTIENYGDNILGSHKAVLGMLELFCKYDVHVTWSTVGLLFHDSISSIIGSLPEKIPSYTNTTYSPYPFIQKLTENSYYEPYILALDLINKISKSPNQEIGTHTYSHYYCLEAGQTNETFNYDIAKAIEVASKLGIPIKSIVFPRNQINKSYFDVLVQNGIIAYRGNADSWIYKPQAKSNETILKKIFRFADTYFPLSGYNSSDLNNIESVPIINIPASRFLRPYNVKLKSLEKYKVKRIKKEMSLAAKDNKLYHLWWHPHNFGVNTKQNLAQLEEILIYFKELQKRYNMKSYTMEEFATLFYEPTK